MTNLQLFEYSGVHPEPIIDPYYNRDKVVIPPTVEETNDLVEKNAKLIELISVFNYFLEQGKGSSDREVADVVSKVIRILDATEGINLTPLSQFFMVYNSSYNSFKGYTTAEKQEFVYEMLKLYCQKRHGMYMSHGYTNSILQVVCDNYSHKRNSKTTIVKVCDVLESLGFTHKESELFGSNRKHYILPDKGDKELFASFKRKYSIVMELAKNEQGKLPDMVFSVGEHHFVVEMKSMKGSGGGQDKQLTEVINFIRYSEDNPKIHYITYLDGEYSNLLHSSTQPKIRRQYEDAVECLKAHPGNFFVNTAGFEVLMKQLVKDYS